MTNRKTCHPYLFFFFFSRRKGEIGGDFDFDLNLSSMNVVCSFVIFCN